MQSSRVPISVVTYDTPLYAYFRHAPSSIDAYNSRFLVGRPKALPENPQLVKKQCRSAARAKANYSAAPAATAASATFSTSRIDLMAASPSASNASSFSSVPSEPRELNSLTFSLSNSQLMASQSFVVTKSYAQSAQFLRSQRLRLVLQNYLRGFGFADEPFDDFDNVFRAFEQLAIDFYAFKRRFTFKVGIQIICNFKALKKLGDWKFDSYRLKAFERQEKEIRSHSILRDSEQVDQICKTLDFRVYQTQLIKLDQDYIVAEMRKRREKRAAEARQAEQREELKKYVREQPFLYH